MLQLLAEYRSPTGTRPKAAAAEAPSFHGGASNEFFHNNTVDVLFCFSDLSVSCTGEHFLALEREPLDCYRPFVPFLIAQANPFRVFSRTRGSRNRTGK